MGVNCAPQVDLEFDARLTKMEVALNEQSRQLMWIRWITEELEPRYSRYREQLLREVDVLIARLASHRESHNAQGLDDLEVEIRREAASVENLAVNSQAARAAARPVMLEAALYAMLLERQQGRSSGATKPQPVEVHPLMFCFGVGFGCGSGDQVRAQAVKAY